MEGDDTTDDLASIVISLGKDAGKCVQVVISDGLTLGLTREISDYTSHIVV